ncbi:Muconolactone delta-isomerase [Rubrobacter radiotolerans]|uniref:Muconolactone delta-isomerase n=1 Tax=Rubrobacter radiotolerans TaxID=42256 RepID=A0A023X1D2_RUBRA|nr:muconolactone Delta-isomerase family protein [Rubrobacter radiotolerans]AHY45825.1 Muconolactone delta-isomerase [Rubrobacter radiotolerans]MDX5893239.1 muconolactone Delta-isomerase family protein [Rubrobacter radiotolerans]SMC03340.1 Muconolactone delta-isomerase [Rubrobacter radiotolerans DSM 5868]
MLVFADIRVNVKNWTAEELWNAWEDEVNAAAGANEAGKIKSIYKVSGQRRVLVTLDVESHDELDRILMSALPMAHNLEIAEILPVRDYWDFAEDVRNRWQ